jgi:hypothetical protein
LYLEDIILPSSIHLMLHVVIVLTDRPSYGAAIQMDIAEKLNKKVILMAKDPLPTPWPVNFSDYIVRSKKRLIMLLEQLRKI